MSKPFVIFAVSALLSSALQIAITSCADTGDDCSGVKWPRLPEAQGPVPIGYASSSDPNSPSPALAQQVQGGTITIANQQLVISYQGDGAERQVVYDIVPGR
jgi:hypothetical protein